MGILSVAQINSVVLVADIVSYMSMAGSIFILACYAAFPRLRRLTFTLVAILAACDIGNQIFDLSGPSPAEIADMEERMDMTNTRCIAQAAGETLMELASALWTFSIAATLFLTVKGKYKLDEYPGRTVAIFAAISFGIPGIFSLVAGVNGVYGPAGGWCWMVGSAEIWRFAAFYIPLWIIMSLNAIIHLNVIWEVRKLIKRTSEHDSSVESLRELARRSMRYPIVLFVVWSFASINRVYEAATHDQVYALFMLQRSFSSSQGFLNAIAYGFTPTVRDAILEGMDKLRTRWCAHRHERVESALEKSRNPLQHGLSSPDTRLPGNMTLTPMNQLLPVGVGVGMGAIAGRSAPLHINRTSGGSISSADSSDEEDTNIVVPNSFASHALGTSYTLSPATGGMLRPAQPVGTVNSSVMVGSLPRGIVVSRTAGLMAASPGSPGSPAFGPKR
ncbi:hypothetical protein EON66_00695 [archaeon]|nr:MAG: hypothetical protein EON66_00695 [archaeon]